MSAPAFRKTYLHSPAWSAACWIKGDGQCDGTVPNWNEQGGYPEQYAGEECGCPCHMAWPSAEFSAAATVEQMEKAHRDYWRHEEHPTA